MKSYKIIIAIIALSLAAGVFGGYRIWGPKEQGPVDIKQLLNALEEETIRIEQKNRDLVASIAASRAEIEASDAIRKENQELKDQVQKALQEKAGMESSLAEARALSERLQKAEREIAEKEGQLARMRNELVEANEKASKGEKLRLMSDELTARISVLEKENRELKSVIDNVSEIMQRKQEAR